jgi:hypothetical protein
MSSASLPNRSTRLPQILMLGGVLLLAVLILITKQEAEVAPATMELPELPEKQL